MILASMRDIEWAVRVTRCWSEWDVSEGCQSEGKRKREREREKKTRAVMCKLCCRKWKSTDVKVGIQHMTQTFSRGSGAKVFGMMGEELVRKFVQKVCVVKC